MHFFTSRPIRVMSLTRAPLVRTQCSRKRRKTERGAPRSIKSRTGLAYLSSDAVNTTTSNCSATRRMKTSRPGRLHTNTLS
eukprot:20059_6